MKRLTILRHAKSSWKDRELEDFDRPLNARGRKAARLVGHEMTRRGMRFDSVLASPAVRIRETIDGVSEGHELPGLGQFALMGDAMPGRIEDPLALRLEHFRVIEIAGGEGHRPFRGGLNPIERFLLNHGSVFLLAGASA